MLLRGPNGAGKTTLLRLCAGLVPIVRGTGRILGFDLATQREAIRRHVGVLGHQNGLYLDLTVGENIRFWGATVGATSRPRPMPRWSGWASPNGWSTCPSANCRQVRSAAPRSRVSSPDGRSCGCSTSPMPASMPAPATNSMPHFVRRRPRGPRSSWRATNSSGPGRWHPCCRRHRRPGPRGRPTSERSLVSVLAHRPAGRRARTCASNGTAGCSPIRYCRSPASRW